ncbi:MAG: dihydroorotate dehydrogenase [Gemmobacter sp.]
MLEALFAEARAEPPVPSEALLARVLADARAAQPRAAGPAGSPAYRIRGWRWRRILAPGGLAAAGLAGFWLGYALPGPVADLAAAAAPGLFAEPADSLGLIEPDALFLLAGLDPEDGE